MAEYQLTFRMPNGRGWRIRTRTPATFSDISRQLVEAAGQRISLADLQALWPDGQAGHFHGFTAAVFESVVKSAVTAISNGRLDVLHTGRDVLRDVRNHLNETGWSDSQCQALWNRLTKIILSLAIGYLRTQFPAITPATADKAVEALSGLLSARR